jgi:hypothetical protein
VAGTAINVGAILLGGILGLSLRKDLSHRHQLFLKTLLGVLALYTGFRMVWTSIHGSLPGVFLQIAAALFALVLGNWIGRSLGLQKQVNALGRYAKERLAKAKSGPPHDFGEGFVTCSLLFCVGPLAIVGAIQDGLQNDSGPLLVKAAMDGLATFAFVRIFGIGAIFSAFPVLAYQGTLSLLARFLKPVMTHPAMIDGISSAGGLMVASTALIILEVRKVPLADYLPALILAPFLRLLIS